MIKHDGYLFGQGFSAIVYRNWSAGDGGADRYSYREKFVNVVEGRLKTTI